MKLTKDQWVLIVKRIPKPPGGGRRRHDSKRILKAILWIPKTGAWWRDLPIEHLSYQTCLRRFQEWRKAGVIRDILEDLVRHLQKMGKIHLVETFCNASFVAAKKGAKKLVPLSAGRALKFWQSSINQAILSPYPYFCLLVAAALRFLRNSTTKCQTFFRPAD